MTAQAKANKGVKKAMKPNVREPGRTSVMPGDKVDVHASEPIIKAVALPGKLRLRSSFAYGEDMPAFCHPRNDWHGMGGHARLIRKAIAKYECWPNKRYATSGTSKGNVAVLLDELIGVFDYLSIPLRPHEYRVTPEDTSYIAYHFRRGRKMAPIVPEDLVFLSECMHYLADIPMLPETILEGLLERVVVPTDIFVDKAHATHMLPTWADVGMEPPAYLKAEIEAARVAACPVVTQAAATKRKKKAA